MTKQLVRFAILALVVMIFWGSFTGVTAQGLTVSAGADLVSRYNWRGLDFGNAFAVQPSLKCEAGGLKAGFWGSYSSSFDEIDTWASYTIGTANAGSFTLIGTDYYYPSAGIRYFNFNNHDDPDGAGAHLVELGASWSGPAKFPITLGGYVNVYNDAGSNAYLQADYSFAVKDATVGLTLGAAMGSTENPSFYGTDDLQVINIGIKATRALRLGQEIELPLSVAFVLNPQQEISYLVLSVGL